MKRHKQRVIAHVDMDCFYVEVERKLDPSLYGRPVAVVQYNTAGDLRTVSPEEDRRTERAAQGIIAVSYEARARGVKRIMTGDEARRVCPEIVLVRVPVKHGKADLTPYRNAGAAVAAILDKRASRCEKASIDEVYIDVTEEAYERAKDWLTGKYIQLARSSHVAGQGDAAAALSVEAIRRGHSGGGGGEGQGSFEELVESWWSRFPEDWAEDERILVCGATIVSELRSEISTTLQYNCSAGIAHSKMFAKLASAMHKPNQQTVVPSCMLPGLLKKLEISRIKGLGAKFGEAVEQKLGIKTAGELAAVPLAKLQALFGEEHGQWLWEVSHGIDKADVQQRVHSKSISCGKTFRGKNALRSLDQVSNWVEEFAREVFERLQKDMADNDRRPTTICVSFTPNTSKTDGKSNSVSRRSKLTKVQNSSDLSSAAMVLVKRWISSNPGLGLVSLYLGVSDFMSSATADTPSITAFLKTGKEEREMKGEQEFVLHGNKAQKRKRSETKGIASFFGSQRNRDDGNTSGNEDPRTQRTNNTRASNEHGGNKSSSGQNGCITKQLPKNGPVAQSINQSCKVSGQTLKTTEVDHLMVEAGYSSTAGPKMRQAIYEQHIIGDVCNVNNDKRDKASVKEQEYVIMDADHHISTPEGVDASWWRALPLELKQEMTSSNLLASQVPALPTDKALDNRNGASTKAADDIASRGDGSKRKSIPSISIQDSPLTACATDQILPPEGLDAEWWQALPQELKDEQLKGIQQEHKQHTLNSRRRKPSKEDKRGIKKFFQKQGGSTSL